jgi:hypothetical protein
VARPAAWRYDADVEPERFDDVGFEVLEIPDTSRRHRPRRRFIALGVLAGSAVSLVAAAALAVTPAQAPQPRPASGAPTKFTIERYPARHSGASPCKAGRPHPAAPPAADPRT